WLNEGFASYIEYLAVDHIFPSWDIWTQFAYADLGVALKLDGLKNTHPIEIEVRHPDEIGEIFDEVSYSKGASIIRMLAGYLGEKNFRDGLRYYLKKHSYQNTSTIHLWQAFEKVSKKPVSGIMKNWTGKPGYPVVRVTEEKDKLILKQSRFFSSPISKKQAKDETFWQVPIVVKSEKSKVKRHLFTDKSSAIQKPKGSWNKLNFGETGFYRVDYPAQMLAGLHSPIKSRKLSAIDRLALVRDAFALAEAGELPTAQALSLMQAYTEETDYTVWVELTSGLSALRNLTYGQTYFPLFEQYCREVYKKIGGDVGWRPKKGESHTTALLRSLLLGQLISFNHRPAIKNAQQIFKKSKVVSAD
ncbi:MAG: ERAP1-like C-terminal domain-containing protein, partial [Candidatus Paceibacterales bacterium]